VAGIDVLIEKLLWKNVIKNVDLHKFTID